MLALALALALALSLIALAVPAAWAGKRIGTGIAGTLMISGGGDYVAHADVVLSSAVSGANQVRFRNEGDQWGAWQAYTAAKDWTLAPGDGAKTIEAQYRAASGKALTLTDTILLDTVAPSTVAQVLSAPRCIAVELVATDATSGVASTSYRIDGGVWRVGTSALLHAGPKRSALQHGVHTVEFSSLDAAGNAEALQRIEVTL